MPWLSKINDNSAEVCHRSEPRIATPGKRAKIQITSDVELDVVNQSSNGICLRFGEGTEIQLNQQIVVAVEDLKKNAVIRWIKAEGNNKSAGCEYV